MVEELREPFLERLAGRAGALGGSLCVGLDPALDALPHHLGTDALAVRRFCMELIEATAPYACAFKPNAAYFEALGASGWEVLIEVVAVARTRALVLLDAKRGDVGHTAEAYASAVFDQIGADACTVNPYLGYDALEPFLRRRGRMTFVLCRTSNPGAGDFQDLRLAATGDPLYLEVARRARAWADMDNEPRVGLVTGATWPKELTQIRAAAPGLPLLIPGVGAQGGDLALAVEAARGVDRSGPYLLSVSRGITGASREPNFAEAAATAAAGYLARLQTLTQAATPLQGAPAASTL